MTTEPSYAEFVAKISKPGSEIIASLSSHDGEVLHMIMGLSGEAGELLDAVKKSIIYRKPLDMKNVREELGDIEFFLQGIRNLYGIDRDEIVKENHGKLSARYPLGTYTNQQAISRADKV